MESDFEYTGNENNQAGFRDRATGTQYWLMNTDGSDVELLEGDQVVIPFGGQRVLWSIREQRQIGYA